METKSINEVRTTILINLICLIALVMLFEYAQYTFWTKYVITTEGILLILFIITFYKGYIQSGLWKFTHKPLKTLDERERALTNKTLRYGYAIFTIAVLALLLFFALSGKEISIVTAVSFILFAHILPASVLAWTEKKL